MCKKINEMKNVCKCGLIICAIVFSTTFTSCTKTKVEIVQLSSKQVVTNKQPVVKVFLENSGSMDGFMCDGSELKDGIYNYLTNVKDHSSKMELYYINSETKKQEVSLSEYIRNLNPANFRKAGGNRAFTNIPDLFTRVLNSVNDTTIAVYISDCILDIPNHAAPDYLHITQTDIHSVFADRIKKINNLSVCIYQLQSTFNGSFFFPKGGSQMYKGKLPYYMFIIGTNEQLANLRKNVPDSNITHGIKNYCAFAPSFYAPVALLQGSKASRSIELNTTRDDKYKFKVEVNLDMSLQGNDVIIVPSNYTLSSSKEMNIESISPIASDDKEYSHIIEFSIADKAFGSVVSLNRIATPSWVKTSNDKQGSSVDPNKTFGIEFLISGISEAFTKNNITSFKLNIKKQ